MPRPALIALGLLAAGCGAVPTAATPARETTAVAASCAGLSPAQQFAAARFVFVGRMLPGPTVRVGGRAVLASPATMRVARWLKGRGPERVKVATALSVTRRGVAIVEDGIEPRPGERWKIYASSRRQPFQTSICLGSARVLSAPADRGAAPASR